MMARARAGVHVRLLIDGVGAHSAAARVLPAMAGSRHRDRRLQSLVRPQDSRAAQFAQPSQISDCRRHPALGGRQKSRRGILHRARRRAGMARFVLRSGRSGRRCGRAPIRGRLGGRRRQTCGRRTCGGGSRAHAAAAPDPATGRAHGRAQFLPSGPDQAEDTVHALLIDACFRARERIIAVTPYFVPDAGLEMAMRLAARRGVEIDLCIPATSNHRLPDFVRHRALRALSEVGVVYSPAALHESRKSRGIRRLARHFRVGQPGFAQPAAQLRMRGRVLWSPRNRLAGELDSSPDSRLAALRSPARRVCGATLPKVCS